MPKNRVLIRRSGSTSVSPSLDIYSVMINSNKLLQSFLIALLCFIRMSVIYYFLVWTISFFVLDVALLFVCSLMQSP